MPSFISCDWGTSRLRLRYVDTAGMHILGETFSKEGIAQTYKAWQAGSPVTDRISYFTAVLAGELKQLARETGRDTEEITLLCSGMGSSSIGIRELPYAPLPFSLDGTNTVVSPVSSANLRNPFYVISGIKSENDIMRGEETEILGLANLIKGLPGEYMAIMPGTHCKHIRVKEGKIIDFQTYMTGELFDLLKSQSTLKYSVEEPGKPDWDSFSLGLQESGRQSLLRNLFRVRVNELMKTFNKGQNHDFLSGLLIGAELQSPILQQTGTIVLTGNKFIRPYYSYAVDYLGFGKKLLEVAEHICDLSALTGQWLIYQRQINMP